jgi:hypothetical protein
MDTYALSINDSGQIVGDYQDSNVAGGALQGFIYSHGTYATIDPPGSTQTSITSINKFGTVVG